MAVTKTEVTTDKRKRAETVRNIKSGQIKEHSSWHNWMFTFSDVTITLCNTMINCLKKGLGRAMAQAVSCRPHTAEARVLSGFNPCGICGGQSDKGTGFSPSTSGFP
jgi:hypothetical protein